MTLTLNRRPLLNVGKIKPSHYNRWLFHSSYWKLDFFTSMTLTLTLDLGTQMTWISMMTYCHTKNKVNWFKRYQPERENFSFWFPWPWPWPYELTTPTWPRCYSDLLIYQKWGPQVSQFKSYQLETDTHRQMDRQTDMCEAFTYPLSRVVNITSQVSSVCRSTATVLGIFHG